jgi:endonuclease/exonuclease/phosphatase family metal-dependent hydrolase
MENLFLRYKVFGYLPGGPSKKSILSEKELQSEGGFLPSQRWKNSFKLFDKDAWRLLTAKAIKRGDGNPPDILCVQEVENMQALRRFNDDFLGGFYDNIVVIDGHDPRLIDVGVLTRNPYLIETIVTHVDEKENGQFIFSRDCLEATFSIGDDKRLTLFVNHLKSKLEQTPKNTEKAAQRRLRQAKRVSAIVKERYPGASFNEESFGIVGDFNDSPDSPYLKPLIADLGLENVLARLDDTRDRWTHWWDTRNVVSQLDYILLSPSLAQRSAGKPYVERRGLSKREATYLDAEDGKKGEEIDFKFERFPEVTRSIEASDHCPLFMTLTV